MQTYMTKREKILHGYLLNNLHILLELTQYQIDIINFFVRIKEVKHIGGKIEVLEKLGVIEYNGCDKDIYQLEHNILYILSKDYRRKKNNNRKPVHPNKTNPPRKTHINYFSIKGASPLLITIVQLCKFFELRK
ncbi:TPA_asm: hypothetical protein G4G51_004810 [Salmonella enterica subsp. enterica serovar Dublin]|uniref:Uncharacterized protein n=1 Tax=Salmonella dublin TaxID=98360 RepID=A0A732D6P1_SALDU|nr:hypothetical protein [Salmonella enterica subsp. enterica serovar Dublin]EKR1405105.1 hypothetical protein [Salmonella enterica subsp. enterica serovar Dublin]HAC6854046.1 hypothetical protein [Salmonella enterica subsp. enterica serovar Dublin]HAE4980132.1 hypothetical protein [Salmonella enterica subsp. enterica serovar Dublin]